MWSIIMVHSTFWTQYGYFLIRPSSSKELADATMDYVGELGYKFV
jgi:hypothetical protein